MNTLHRRDVLFGALAAGALLPVLDSRGAEGPGMTTFAAGLRFPEGPMALADGSVAVCEIAAGRVSRVHADGKRETVAETGGGPAGCAVGPDGAWYITNTGGIECKEVGGRIICVGRASDYAGGHIDRVDPRTGKVDVLYREVDGNRLSAPDDLVLDDHGGIWFSDAGARAARSRDYGGLYYAKTDGSFIKEVVYPFASTNGVALSPDGKTVYLALPTERMVAAFPINGDGVVDRGTGYHPGRPVVALPAGVLLDSMKVEADGTLCLASVLDKPGILRVRPNGDIIGLVPYRDVGTTNLAFGGKDLRTAFITESVTGLLLKTTWPSPGLKLNYQST